MKSSRLLYYTYSNKELQLLPTWLEISACISNLSYEPFRLNKTINEPLSESDNEDENGDRVEENGCARTMKRTKTKIPLYLDGVKLPQNCIWKNEIPPFNFKYSIGIVFKLFAMPSTSNVKKSCLIRGQKYLTSKKMSKIKYSQADGSIICKASFSSSF